MGERCGWAVSEQIYLDYHDTEWGMPEYDSRALWEKLILDGFQAGLSWITILKKRDNFREAFQGFYPNIIAEWGEAEVQRLLANPGIIRHRGKIEATINNARAASTTVDEHGSLAAFFWSFEPSPAERPEVVDHAALMTMAQTGASKAMSKALKKAGWRFVGPTTCYALMQAAGIVNDHLEGCFRRPEVEELRSGLTRPG